jgi:hypothetical protein
MIRSRSIRSASRSRIASRCSKPFRVKRYSNSEPGTGSMIPAADSSRPPGTLDGPEPYGFSGRARASAAAAQPLAATAMNWSLP